MGWLTAPDPKARLDPRPGVKPRKLDRGRRALEEVGDAHGVEAIVRLELAVQRAQEVVAVVWVLLPGVLAVEDDRREVRSALVRQPIARALELRDHVADRVLWFHVAIDEADPVRELSVAEDHRGAVREAIRPVQESRLEQRADVIAPKLDNHRAREHTLAGGEPPEAGLADRIRRLGRHRTFRRPNP